MSEKNYVINVKTKAGTIFTVRGDTAEELTSNINSVLNAQIPDFIGGLEEALLGVTHSTPVAVAPAPAPASAVDLVTAIGGTVVAETPRPAFAPVPPPAVAPPSLAGQRMCNHGPMVTRKGVGAKGEWKGYFCPTPKGTPDQCDPQWLTKRDPEWASV